MAAASRCERGDAGEEAAEEQRARCLGGYNYGTHAWTMWAGLGQQTRRRVRCTCYDDQGYSGATWQGSIWAGSDNMRIWPTGLGPSCLMGRRECRDGPGSSKPRNHRRLDVMGRGHAACEAGCLDISEGKPVLL